MVSQTQVSQTPLSLLNGVKCWSKVGWKSLKIFKLLLYGVAELPKIISEPTIRDSLSLALLNLYVF